MAIRGPHASSGADAPGLILADVSKQTKDSLDKLLLGKEVRPLVELPAPRKGWMSISLLRTANERMTEGSISAP